MNLDKLIQELEAEKDWAVKESRSLDKTEKEYYMGYRQACVQAIQLVKAYRTSSTKDQL